MLPYRDSIITKIALLVFFVIVIGYAYFEIRGYLFGPRIEVGTAMQTVTTGLVTITGTSTHIASLSMNGTEIPVTEDGVFREPYLLAPGYNRIVLDAVDKYGHTSRKVLEIAYVPPEGTASETAATSSPKNATTTASTTPHSP